MAAGTQSAVTRLSEGDRQTLDHALLSSHLEMMPTAAAGNIFNAVMMVLPFLGNLSPLMLMLCVGLVLLGSAAVVTFYRSHKQTRPEQARRALRHAAWLAFGVGTCWAAAIFTLMWHSNQSQLMMLGLLAAGMMSAATITCVTVPWAARGFILPIALGAIIFASRFDGWNGWATQGMLVAYLGVLNQGIMINFRSHVGRVLGQLELADSSETVRMLLNDYEEQGSDWLWQTDANGCIVSPSSRFSEAAESASLAGRRLASLFDDRPETDMLAHALISGQPFRDIVLTRSTARGTRWWRITGRPEFNRRGQLLEMRGVATDITEAKQAEARVTHMAHHDALTDLPNRFMLNETIEWMLSQRTGDEVIGLLYIDLDHFKLINDTLGHAVGDNVLKHVSRLIEQNLHAGDMVARLGGDEFAVLFARGTPRETVIAAANMIVQHLSGPALIDGHRIITGTSIGIAFAPQDGASANELLKNADLALYRAKGEGRARVACFEPSMRDAIEERRALEIDLMVALGNGEMRLHYQPVVNIHSGRISGYEALLRWQHPVRGLIMPDQFIPIAEENGYIVQLGEWVIRKALSELATWPSHVRVAVNLSPTQLRTSALVSTVMQALATTGVVPNRLELEITESVLMLENETVLSTLHRLRAMGVRIALDDFGTGYSSLNYLRSFPFDKIKIDRCFVKDIDTSEDCRAIVRAVTALATSLGMDTTAEGVENLSQLARLKEEGCIEVQGFYFSDARAPEALGGWQHGVRSVA